MQFKFDRIYLVARQPNIHGKYYITSRRKGKRPKFLQFFGSRPDEAGGSMGVLVHYQEWWDETFGDEEDFISGSDTPEGAAEKLVASNSNITYGCPLCTASFAELEEAQVHVEGELTSFLEMFTLVEDRELVCPICQKTYTSKRHYENHVISHVPKQEEPCLS